MAEVVPEHDGKEEPGRGEPKGLAPGQAGEAKDQDQEVADELCVDGPHGVIYYGEGLSQEYRRGGRAEELQIGKDQSLDVQKREIGMRV